MSADLRIPAMTRRWRESAYHPAVLLFQHYPRAKQVVFYLKQTPHSPAMRIGQLWYEPFQQHINALRADPTRGSGVPAGDLFYFIAPEDIDVLEVWFHSATLGL